MANDDPQLPVTSSSEPDWPPDARDCYRDALQALLDINIAFVVGGAFAVHTHTGIWRPTKDLDILLPAKDMPQALEQLRRRGFKTWVKDPVWLAKAERGAYFVDLITGIGNASLGVDSSWIDHSTPEVVLGIPCQVMGVEELIATKIFVAFRERFDGADVVHLLRSCFRSLDWTRLLLLAGSHWELLFWSLVLFAYVYPAHTDAIPAHVWDAMTTAFSDRVKHPNKEAPFRGTLVDPRMFAIDAEEWGERNLYKEFCASHPWLLQTESPLRSEE